MLTVMCPNCHHRFPAPGCCEIHDIDEDNDLYDPTSTTCYYGGLLVPKSYPSGAGCSINASTIIHRQPILNAFNYPSMSFDLEKSKIEKQKAFLQRCGRVKAENLESLSTAKNEGSEITSCCELTGGSVTITTPNVESGGGCMIESSRDSGGIHTTRTQHMEIRPKLSGNSQKTKMFVLPPSGCQELPGTRRNIYSPAAAAAAARVVEEAASTFQFEQNIRRGGGGGDQELEQNRCYNCCCNNVHNLYPRRSNDLSVSESSHVPPIVLDSNSTAVAAAAAAGVRIEVNATVQLPAHLGQCRVNITATTTTTSPPDCLSGAATSRSKNNLTGGGLVQKSGGGGGGGGGETRNTTTSEGGSFEERRDRSPTTPVSWLMPCPWTFDNAMTQKEEETRLSEIKRLFETCGWYHEGLSWQQSEHLLKNASIGRWLIRDSSDSRYMFAVSVQTARGPTSVRVHYCLGHFRLDAEPRLAFAIPFFDCPIKMLEYYVEYSKSVDERRKEVWVDYTGQLYSEIYLTKPLVKQVRSLSHLARLVVNRNKLPTEHLPPLIINYLAEYPYSI